MSLDPQRPCIALLSTSGSELLADALRRTVSRDGTTVDVWASPFNQIPQTIANGTSPLYLQEPIAVILLAYAEDLFADYATNPFTAGTGERNARIAEAVRDVEDWITTLRSRLPRALLVLNTVYMRPLNTLTGLAHHSSWGLNDMVEAYNSALGRIARSNDNVVVHDTAALACHLGYCHWADPRLWYLARCRLSDQAMQALSRSYAAMLRGWMGKTRKVLVLDLDNTLWGGVLGELGSDRLILGAEGSGLAFAEFQSELLNLARKGVLLCICSKNNEPEVLEVLRTHPGMRLRENDFAARRVNWQDKPSNLREIARELNLGLDSFVFIDDHPAEREFVRAVLPEVAVPDWPRDPSDYSTALIDVGIEHFPKLYLTAEDRSRSNMYFAQTQRRELAERALSVEEYFWSLDMVAQVGFADRFAIPRIAQLTQKTNQFNVTSRRYTETEIRELSLSPAAIVLWLRLKDKFGDEGIVGVAIFKQAAGQAQTWEIDVLLLSCRVLGRGVEAAFMARACDILISRGAGELVGHFIPSGKNNVAAGVYESLGFEPAESGEPGTRWRLCLAKSPISAPGWIKLNDMEEVVNA